MSHSALVEQMLFSETYKSLEKIIQNNVLFFQVKEVYSLKSGLELNIRVEYVIGNFALVIFNSVLKQLHGNVAPFAEILSRQT